MDSLRVQYVPREDATPEGELSVLVQIYKICLESPANKKAAPRQSRPDDGTKSKEDSADESIIQQSA